MMRLLAEKVSDGATIAQARGVFCTQAHLGLYIIDTQGLLTSQMIIIIIYVLPDAKTVIYF
jgi:hypothetical protein